MPAYAAHDAIKEREEKEDAATLTRDNWIDKRAKEIKAEYPTEPTYFASSSLATEIRLGLYSQNVIEAYRDFITIAAYDRAEQEWENRFSWLLNDDEFEG